MRGLRVHKCRLSLAPTHWRLPHSADHSGLYTSMHMPLKSNLGSKVSTPDEQFRLLLSTQMPSRNTTTSALRSPCCQSQQLQPRGHHCDLRASSEHRVHRMVYNLCFFCPASLLNTSLRATGAAHSSYSMCTTSQYEHDVFSTVDI